MTKLSQRQSDKRKRKRRPINVLASVMTTMNLYFGIASIFASIGQEFEKAAYFILLAIVFDTLDGFVARLTDSVSDFGKELDSLCDIVSFGIAPAVMLFVAYLPEAGPGLYSADESIVGKTGSYMAIIFAICAALRLARFNTWQADRRDVFVGLPSPAAGGTMAAFVLFLTYFENVVETHKFGVLAYYALGPLAVILAFLMVSNVTYPKGRAKDFLFAPKLGFQFLGVFAILAAVFHYGMTQHPSVVLFPLAMLYVVFGPLEWVYYGLFRRGERRFADAFGEDLPVDGRDREDFLVEGDSEGPVSTESAGAEEAATVPWKKPEAR